MYIKPVARTFIDTAREPYGSRPIAKSVPPASTDSPPHIASKDLFSDFYENMFAENDEQAVDERRIPIASEVPAADLSVRFDLFFKFVSNAC